MSARLDHAAEARAELDAILLHFDEGENGAARASTALTHATLALVEQQRIANLIALAGLEMNGPLRHLAVKPDGEYHVDVSDEVREGLGL